VSRNLLYDKFIAESKDYFQDFDFKSIGFTDNSNSEKACALLDRMQAVYEAKDSDYSENDLPMGNLRESIELGIEPWKGVLLRIGDKKRRIGSFIKKESFLVKDEAVDDTLVDMANYSFLGCALMGDIGDEAINETWKTMAKDCVLAKIVFENKHNEGVPRWSIIMWPRILTSYNILAKFAREN
jgi:hypothetical protein